MPSCLLTIEFYRPQRQYHGGEKVTGWIRVQVERNVRCRNLHLAARWATSGRTDIASRVYHQFSLYEGVWKPGELYEYAFEFEAPAGPFTYHGRNFALNHFVSVWADLPWTIETRQEAAFELLPDPHTNRNTIIETPLAVRPARARPARSIPPGSELLIASLLLLASALLVIPLGTWALIGAGAAILMALSGLRHLLPRAALPELRWEVPRSMAPGFPCPVHLNSGKVRWTRIRDVKIVLCGFERTATSVRDHRERFESSLLRQAFVMDVNSLNGDKATSGVCGNLLVPVPDISAWSLDLPGAQVVWALRTTVRLAWWPDKVDWHELALIPPGYHLPPEPPGT
jgi:hypothetical protein